MERDLDVVPGAKIAFWVALIIGVLVLVGTTCWYPIGYMFHSIVGPLDGNGPVDFHGRIVDPDGNPIPGATLSAKVSVYGIFRGHYQRDLHAESDDDGHFRIKVRNGRRIHLHDFSKQGFRIRGRPAKFKGLSVDVIENWNFVFDPTVRDRTETSLEDPFLFVMEPAKSP